MLKLPALLTVAAALFAAPLSAQSAAAPPRLVVVISVDQFGANLLDRYRGEFGGGFARLLSGASFNGYQSHAATETCPGHSTLLTGDRPARTGIIGNDWYDGHAARADKRIYCVEDESVPGSTHSAYIVSLAHLRVPTLGDRMKAASPASRVVSVSGKDRSAALMAGKSADQAWWWSDGGSLVSYAGKPAPATVARANAAIAAQLAQAQPPLEEPPVCAALDRPIAAGSTSVGTYRFGRAAGDAKGFKNSDELDGAVLATAAGLAQELRLGRGSAPDLLTIGLSVTDFIGHMYGNGGPEMCLNLLALDRSLGDFLTVLDQTGVDYLVVLTADHGSQDIPERGGQPPRERISADVSASVIGARVAQTLRLAANPLHAIDAFGDIWIDPAIVGAQRSAVLDEAVRQYRALPQVATVFTHAELAAAPLATTSPDRWSLIEKARASFDDQRSGDLVVLLKEGVVPIAAPIAGRVAGHGVPWDADRRVPILFWRKGLARSIDPTPVETVDIMPTLAAMLRLPLGPGEVDGRCLELGAGMACPRAGP